jgi:competence protein ComEA
MGVSRYASSNLEKYRKKGGKIKSKQQFFKIYGMEKYIAILDSLIRINENQNQNSENANNATSATNHAYPTSKDTSTVSEKKNNRAMPIPTVKLKVIELNGADSFELESIRGIGAFLAARIIKYRNKLGGFYNIGQLEEVYGMRPQTFMEINHLVKANADLISKMKINGADEKTLAAHPYIGRKAASILIRYKKQHGNFKSIEDLMKVRIYDEEEIQRLKWYIDFTE